MPDYLSFSRIIDTLQIKRVSNRNESNFSLRQFKELILHSYKNKNIFIGTEQQYSFQAKYFQILPRGVTGKRLHCCLEIAASNSHLLAGFVLLYQWEPWQYSFSPVSHSRTSQLWVAVTSCMLRRAEYFSPSVLCRPVTQHEQHFENNADG